MFVLPWPTKRQCFCSREASSELGVLGWDVAGTAFPNWAFCHKPLHSLMRSLMQATVPVTATFARPAWKTGSNLIPPLLAKLLDQRHKHGILLQKGKPR